MEWSKEELAQELLNRDERIKQLLERERIARDNRARLLTIEENEKEAKKNRNFVQIERGAFGFINQMIAENPIAARVLFFLVQRMDKQNGVFVCNEELAKLFDCSVRTIFRAMKYLKEHNWLRAAKKSERNVYQINCIFWRNYANKKEYAFYAMIKTSEKGRDICNRLDATKVKNFPVIFKRDDEDA